MNDCTLCPRMCHVNRAKEVGFCNAKNKLKIARASLHYFEEPPISGSKGSGTIFFSNCNLKCIYCQNYQISTKGLGKTISIKKFSDTCLKLQEKGALNINLVTPTHYVPLIIEGLKLAKKKGLNIPIIYNSSGYENIDTIKMLNGIIDIYMPDFKYYNDEYAVKYSNAKDYFKYASKALEEMYKQVPNIIIENDIMKKGIIVRHLILPNLKEDSKKILKYLYNTYHDNIYISIMNQYTPLTNVKHIKELNRTITNEEYQEVINYAIKLGIENAFIQEDGTQKESFIPDFTKKGVL